MNYLLLLRLSKKNFTDFHIKEYDTKIILGKKSILQARNILGKQSTIVENQKLKMMKVFLKFCHILSILEFEYVQPPKKKSRAANKQKKDSIKQQKIN